MKPLSPEKFYQALQQIGLGAVLNHHLEFEYVNDNLLKLSEYALEELLGQPFAKLYPQGHKVEKYIALEAKLKAGETYTADLKLCCQAGRNVWAHITLIPIVDDANTTRYLLHGQDITERKTKEEDFRRFRKAVNQASEYIFIASASDGQILDANNTACRHLQYTRADLRAMKFWDIEASPLSIDDSSYLTEISTKNHLSARQAYYQTASGEQIPVELSIRHEEIEGEELLIIVARNITEKLQAAATLQRQEAYLYTVINNADYGLWVVNQNYELVIFNEPYLQLHESLFGEKLKLHSSPLQHLDKSIQEFWYPLLQRAFAGEQFVYEIWFQHRYWEFSLTPVWINQVVDGVAIYTKDISERKEYEKNILAAKTLLEDLQEFAKLGIWKYDLATQQLEWSRQIFVTLGLSPDAPTPTPDQYQQLVHPKDLPYLTRALLEARIEGKEYEMEIRHRLPDGSYRWTMARGQAVYDRNNQIVALQGTMLDIDDQKKIEEQLRRTLLKEQRLNEELAQHEENLRHANLAMMQANEDLRKINTELDRFVYSASHDLRAPIASVLGLINLCRITNDIDKIYEYLRLQEVSVKRLDNFIQDILDYSQNTRLELRRERIYFEELIVQVFEQYSFLDNATKINRNIRVEGEAMFFTDRRRLNVILNNLISNAIRYANLQQDQPYVQVDVLISPDNACITIIDNGIGIEEEHQPKVFEMFYRATTVKSGSGLGLYIVRETIQKLNAQIELHSVFGEGTTFVITLPNLGEPMPDEDDED